MGTMKPAFIAVLALFCLSMAFAAPAPAPLLPVVVASGTTTSLALPSVVLASGTGVVPAQLFLEPRNCFWLEPFWLPNKALKNGGVLGVSSNDHPIDHSTLLDFLK